MEVILRNVRLSFPELWKAREFKGTVNYSAKFFVEPGSANDKAINDTITAVAKAKFPEKWEMYLEEFRPDKKAYPYINGKRVEYSGAEGKWVLTAKRKETDGRPLVIDQRKTPLTPADGKPYSGCYVNVKVDIYAQDGENKGIRCSLVTVQFAGDGEAFSGSKPATDDGFDDISDTGEADDLL